MSKTVVITVSGSFGGVGKTRLVERLLPALKNAAAIKVQSRDGKEVSVLVEADSGASPGKDTARFLAAGARRAYLVSGAGEGVREAVEEIIGSGDFDVVVVESNRLARELASDVAFFVTGEGEAKAGADVCRKRADVVVCGIRDEKER